MQMNLKFRIKEYIPNTITCMNVLCGTLSILAASHPDVEMAGIPGWEWSILFIVLAAVADFFDGFMARLLHVGSPIGADLDSLSDQVSFGVAPAMLLAFSLYGHVPLWEVFLPVIIPVAAAIRLAKFNVDTRQTTGFLGMPVPANAVFWIGYVSYLHRGVEWLANPWVLTVALVFISWFMVSEVPMLSLKFKTWGFRENMARYLLIICSAALFILLWLPGMLWIIVLYAVMSLLFAKSGKQPTDK